MAVPKGLPTTSWMRTVRATCAMLDEEFGKARDEIASTELSVAKSQCADALFPDREEVVPSVDGLLEPSATRRWRADNTA